MKRLLSLLGILSILAQPVSARQSEIFLTIVVRTPSSQTLQNIDQVRVVYVMDGPADVNVNGEGPTFSTSTSRWTAGEAFVELSYSGLERKNVLLPINIERRSRSYTFTVYDDEWKCGPTQRSNIRNPGPLREDHLKALYAARRLALETCVGGNKETARRLWLYRSCSVTQRYRDIRLDPEVMEFFRSGDARERALAETALKVCRYGTSGRLEEAE